MLNKAKAWIHSKRLMNNDIIHIVTPTVQEDTRSIEAVKRVRKMFDQCAESINAMALKRHECADPDLCTKKICFKNIPDKIAHTETVPLKTKEELTQGIKKRRVGTGV